MGKNKLSYIVSAFLIVIPFFSTEATNLKIHNDLDKEKEGRVLEVENLVTTESPKSKFRLKIYPGDIKELVAGDVLKFSVNRIFTTHKIKYEVVCNKASNDAQGEIQKILTFTQIHDDKIGSECRLVGYGHWSRRTGTTWIKREEQVE